MQGVACSSLFLDALSGTNTGRAPVWLMRQAGRSLPSYRALREKHSLKELFFTPELAAAATLMPVEQLGVDAAILFSDICVVALSLGLRLDFKEGPQVDPPITPDKVPFLSSDLSRLDPIIETVCILAPELTVPLIGFCGGPFTVATYLIDGGMDSAKKWIYQCPEIFTALLDKICAVSIAYLQRQAAAGVSAIQIFDSWANVLSKEHFERFCMPYYRKMIASLPVPVIVFMRGAHARLDALSTLDAALSLDWQMPLKDARQKTKQTLQGNLDPDLLFAPKGVIREKGRALLLEMQGDPAFIAALGHGVKPDAPIDAVKELVLTLQGKG